MRESLFDRQRFDVLAWVLAFKAAILGAVYLLAELTPASFNVAGYLANLHWTREPPSTATWFSTWDATHYLFISEHGYVRGHPTLAFYALWPLLIRAAAWLLAGHTLAAALLMSNLCSAVALWLLYRLVQAHTRSSPAASVSLLLLYPGALFLAFPYSESLYLLLSVLMFERLFRSDARGAGLSAFLLTLTRPLGMFAMLPLGYELWRPSSDGKRSLRRATWLLLPVPLALAAHFVIMYAATGDALAGVKAQRYFISEASLLRLLQPLRFVQVYLDVRSLHGFLNSFLDRLWFTLAALLMPIVYRISRPMFWYTLGAGLFSAVTVDFMSFTRYLCVLFPVFVAAGQVLAPSRLAFGLVMGLFTCMQLWLTFLHVHAFWVG